MEGSKISSQTEKIRRKEENFQKLTNILRKKLKFKQNWNYPKNESTQLKIEFSLPSIGGLLESMLCIVHDGNYEFYQKHLFQETVLVPAKEKIDITKKEEPNKIFFIYRNK